MTRLRFLYNKSKVVFGVLCRHAGEARYTLANFNVDAWGGHSIDRNRRAMGRLVRKLEAEYQDADVLLVQLVPVDVPADVSKDIDEMTRDEMRAEILRHRQLSQKKAI
jgi:hypothetical protein